MLSAAAEACASYRMLKTRVRADLRVYKIAVEALHVAAVHPSVENEFDKALRDVEIAKRSFEGARDRLKTHIATHACA